MFGSLDTAFRPGSHVYFAAEPTDIPSQGTVAKIEILGEWYRDALGVTAPLSLDEWNCSSGRIHVVCDAARKALE